MYNYKSMFDIKCETFNNTKIKKNKRFKKNVCIINLFTVHKLIKLYFGLMQKA